MEPATRHQAKLTREDRARLDASLAKIRNPLDFTPEDRARFTEVSKILGPINIGMLMTLAARDVKLLLTPEDRVQYAETGKLLEQLDEYQKDLLRRLGVRANLEDRGEFEIQLWAAARHAGFSDEEFWRTPARELDAVLEFKAWELRLTRGTDPSPEAHPSRSEPKRRPGKQAKVTDFEKVKQEIRSLKEAKCSQREICVRLGNKPRPPNAAWKGLSWPDALKNPNYMNSVKSWLSRQ